MEKYFKAKKQFFIFICIFFIFPTTSFSKEKIEIDSKLESKIKKEIKLFPYDSNLKFSLADLYVNYLLKIEKKHLV